MHLASYVSKDAIYTDDERIPSWKNDESIALECLEIERKQAILNIEAEQRKRKAEEDAERKAKTMAEKLAYFGMAEGAKVFYCQKCNFKKRKKATYKELMDDHRCSTKYIVR